MKPFNWCQSKVFSTGGFLVLLFFGGLLWAKEQEPFSNKWFSLKLADGRSFKCAAVLPKPLKQRRVIIYAHASSGTLMNNGFDLRQMAELGISTLSMEYDQDNEAVWADQFEAVLQYLKHQPWVDTNAVVWVGMGLGAKRMLDFALQHPEQQPQLLVQVSNGRPELALARLRCHGLFIRGQGDKTFSLTGARPLAAGLQTNGMTVELKVIPDVPSSLEPERGVIFRGIGEYVLMHLKGENDWGNYYSIAQWQAEAPGLGWFWLPAGLWLGGGLWWRWRHRVKIEIKFQSHEVVLRWVAAGLALWAATVTAIHLVPPRLAVSDRTLSVARKFLVTPKERNDFEFLAAQPIWRGKKSKTLLDHVELAGYNRELINWQLDDKIYQDFVLSPVITGKPGEQLDWRRPLWEEFYPRIRHESSPADAAKIVVRHLRERVTIAVLPELPQQVPDIWLRQITDQSGFEIIYVAALRSVGVPARLTSGQAEYWDGNQWQTAPEPAVKIW